MWGTVGFHSLFKGEVKEHEHTYRGIRNVEMNLQIDAKVANSHRAIIDGLKGQNSFVLNSTDKNCCSATGFL